MGRTGTLGRRALLAAGAVTLAGCTSDGDGGPGRPRQPSAAERAARAEAALRRRSVATSEALLERYDAVLAAHPSLAARLTPLRASVAAHAKALGEGVTDDPSGSATADGGASPLTGRRTPGVPDSPAATGPSGSPGVRPSATARGPVVPADPAAALRELTAAVRKAADAHTDALLDAPPEYARLLASVAAAGAAHAYLLTEGGRA
ncbi:hypothetical protein [Streptomyces sp. NPDC006551]|uniref:hypothetical protein n=1 Tax=Streptomyces sp. NPDC006551 TaxID=3157178 RepID=UPI0033B36A21